MRVVSNSTWNNTQLFYYNQKWEKCGETVCPHVHVKMHLWLLWLQQCSFNKRRSEWKSGRDVCREGKEEEGGFCLLFFTCLFFPRSVLQQNHKSLKTNFREMLLIVTVLLQSISSISLRSKMFYINFMNQPSEYNNVHKERILQYYRLFLEYASDVLVFWGVFCHGNSTLFCY